MADLQLRRSSLLSNRELSLDCWILEEVRVLDWLYLDNQLIMPQELQAMDECRLRAA